MAVSAHLSDRSLGQGQGRCKRRNSQAAGAHLGEGFTVGWEADGVSSDPDVRGETPGGRRARARGVPRDRQALQFARCGHRPGGDVQSAAKTSAGGGRSAGRGGPCPGGSGQVLVRPDCAHCE